MQISRQVQLIRSNVEGKELQSRFRNMYLSSSTVSPATTSAHLYQPHIAFRAKNHKIPSQYYTRYEIDEVCDSPKYATLTSADMLATRGLAT